MKKLKTDAEHQRTMDGMADDYSVRARRARVEQGLPGVLSDPVALNRLADMLMPSSPLANVSAAA